MLPLSLLNAAQGQPMLVELKSGETINGHLINCDTWMNLTLNHVIQTSADGEQFTKLDEMYVRGNLIKYLRVPEHLLTEIKEERIQRNAAKERERYQNNQQRDRRQYRYNNQDHQHSRGGSRGGARGGGPRGGSSNRGGPKRRD